MEYRYRGAGAAHYQDWKENPVRHTLKMFYTALVLSMPTLSNGANMEQPTFLVSLACTDNPACIYTGQYMPIEITVKNTAPYPIGFPRNYLQARGPAMTLIDRETQKQRVLKLGLTDKALMQDLTTLNPGQTLTMTTVINEAELTAFRAHYVDLVAEIGYTARIRVPDQEETVQARGVGRLKIIGKDTLERIAPPK
jgi:hypothetical protein